MERIVQLWGFQVFKPLSFVKVPTNQPRWVILMKQQCKGLSWFEVFNAFMLSIGGNASDCSQSNEAIWSLFRRPCILTNRHHVNSGTTSLTSRQVSSICHSESCSKDIQSVLGMDALNRSIVIWRCCLCFEDRRMKGRSYASDGEKDKRRFVLPYIIQLHSLYDGSKPAKLEIFDTVLIVKK